MGVWVLTEWREERLKDTSLGLLAEGKRVTDARGERLSALVLGRGPEEEIQKLFVHGADEVILVELPTFGIYDLFVTSKVLTRLVRDFQPHLILFPAGHLGNELAGRLSVTCGAGLVTNGARLEIEDGQVVVVKNSFRDRIENRIRVLTDLHLVTLKPKELQPARGAPLREKRIIRPQIPWDDRAVSVRVVDCVQGDPRNIDLADAEWIVAGGKGMGDSKTFELIHTLAHLLTASIGGSREAVDRGWLPFTRQIGQTGRTVSPRCLIAVGISGAIQFLKGMEDSQYVIAVNKDRRAPIFDVADLKIHGDLHEVIPALIKQIRELKGSEAEDHPV